VRIAVLAGTLLSLHLLSGCLATTIDEGEGDYHGEVDDEEPFYDELEDSGGTVRSQLRACSTRGVAGLSQQIIDEIQCMAPDALVRLDESATIQFTGSAVFPYFAPEVASSLTKVASSRAVLLTSGFRTVIQQHLIYSWYKARRCKIPKAARPGNSRHETVRAVDVNNYSRVRSLMQANGFEQTVRGDVVHFDYLAAPSIGDMGILAFQRLWNRNNPKDPLEENGDYDPATVTRINRSPAGGFAMGASCQP